jgi:CRP/FNR family transcriptional regulator
MSTGFQTYLLSHTNLGNSAVEQIISAATPRTLQRNELLLQEGQVCRHKTFVVKGLMRIFGTDTDASEHILQFSPENTWVVDGESYDHQTPSIFTISAVEQSELLCWTRTDFDRLLKDLPALQTLSQQLILSNHYRNRHRLFTALSATPEKKYEDFVRTFPDLLPRLPLHMIAAYLGISLKTLTRIRHAQIHRSI